MSNDSGVRTLESMSQAVWYNKWTLDKFKKFLDGEILEVGCGIGNFTKDLVKFGSVWAIDINKECIAQTKKKVDGKALVGFGDIETGECFFKSKKFDSIVCLNVLEHIREDGKALMNLYNFLNKEGILILLVPAHNFLFGEIDKSIGHYRRYDKAELNKLVVRTGFKIVNERIINILGGIGWWISSKLFANNKVEENKIKIFNLLAPIVLLLENIIEPPIGTSILMVVQK